MIHQIDERSPHFAAKDGIYDSMPTEWWTSGFWPGILWVMYDMTGKEYYKEAAWEWDKILESWLIRPNKDLHHDVGFQFLSTAVIKHEITGDEEGLRRGLEAANFLVDRFNPAGNFIRAWNGDRYGWAIIDCMMNISLLFWASRVSGDPRYKHIAARHADTTLQYFVREDGSVNHIVSFDAESGQYIEAFGGQGYGTQSAWSRGTAWALYGFANACRNTGDSRYLHASKRIAHFFLAALPEDHVPYWDFRLDSHEGEPRDSSAAAITASGILEIAAYVPEAEKKLYTKSAEAILYSLSEHYATWDNPDHQAILIGATGNKPENNYIDGSLIYGDYYYIEAFAKLNGWGRRIF
jgi:unsaturated chondroitin disaccharide hydrolase